jgi:hypothetical protein
MRFWLSIFLILSCVLHTTCPGEIHKDSHLGQKVKDQIERLSHEERLFLEKFFRKLIRSEDLGYVLFGSKPACLSGYFIRLPLGNMLRGADNFAIKKGWEVWKKYEYLFPHPKYLIFEETHVRGDETIHPIYFINKTNLLRILREQEEVFKKELIDNFNPERFLEDLCAKQSLSEMIKSHEGLLGILLGYGVESSMSYHRRDLMWKSQMPLLCEEVNLEAVSQYNFRNPIFEDIHPIQFMGNPQSQEVQAILEQNAKERSHLINIYSQGRWLEITLNKLVE